MKVIVVGGGIGGLVAAASMLSKGIDVVLVEKAPLLKEIGAGIQIGANGTLVLKELGLEGALSKCAVAPLSWDLLDYRTGRLIFSTPLGERAAESYGALLYNVHRADLIGMLAAALRVGVLRLGLSCVEVGQTADCAWVRLSNGDIMEGDAVIGADGIRSVIREQLWGQDDMQYAKILMWRALIPADRIAHVDLPRRGNYWIGPGRTIISYWVRDDLYSVLASVPDDEVQRESWTESGDIEEFHRSFAEGEPRLLSMLQEIDSAFITGMYYRHPLERWTTGRITLLGDAAHPMVPFLAQGACQAIEDAWAVATMLERHGEDVETAFAAYEAMRRPRTTGIQSGARAMVKLVHESDEARILMRNGRWKGMSRIDPLAETTWGFAWSYNILEEVNRPAGEVPGLSGAAEGFSLGRPESRRAYDYWKTFISPEDAAHGHDGIRAAYERLLLETLGREPSVDVRRTEINGVSCLSVGSSQAPYELVVLHFHGGGYVLGSAESSRDYAQRIASAIGAECVSVDYRLAPEHPYPAALDDALAAYRGLLGHGISPDRVILSGESSGAGLAIALALVARAAQLPVPAGIIAVCPLVDLTLGSESIRLRKGKDPAANRDTLAYLVSSYFQAHEPRDPLVSPLHGELAGLPPLFITAATNEGLFGDAERLADRARAAGVEVTSCWVDDSVHVYPIFDFLPETEVFLAEISEWAKQMSYST
jgi:salicylate hydroxylase